MELRDLIAETLAGHEEGWVYRDGGRVAFCECAQWSTPYDAKTPAEVRVEHCRHVADVLLAALGDRVLPEGGETRTEWRVIYDDKQGRAVVWSHMYDTDLDSANRRLVQCRAIWSTARFEVRTFTQWVDRTIMIGPWRRPVDTEETPNG